MIRSRAAVLLPLLLAACGHKDSEPAQETSTATVTFTNPGNVEAGGPEGGAQQAVAIQVPGFAAKLDVPGLSLAGASFGLDGMSLSPGTRITGLKITGAAGDGSGGEGHGAVDAAFASPQSPDQVIAYYKRAAPGGGWTEVPPTARQQFAATKAKGRGTEHLAILVAPQGTGSTGRLLVSGG